MGLCVYCNLKNLFWLCNLMTSLWKPSITSRLNWQTTNNTTVLFRTTFTRTIKLNLLLKWPLGFIVGSSRHALERFLVLLDSNNYSSCVLHKYVHRQKLTLLSSRRIPTQNSLRLYSFIDVAFRVQSPSLQPLYFWIRHYLEWVEIVFRIQ